MQTRCAGTCKLPFTSQSAFDKHQTMTVAKDNRATVHCHAPETVGLVLRDGAWGFPASEKEITYKTERVVAPVERTCERCGATFERPAGRGRPPKNCADCRAAIAAEKN